MSIHAGAIITAAGKTTLQRVQSAGLGNVTIPIDTIREVGNELIVDQVVQEPDFTFSIDSFDVSCDLEAILQGKQSPGPASGAAFPDPDGTEYKWDAPARCTTIVSPWKDLTQGSAGTVSGGHLVPAYICSRIQYQFGVTANAQQTAELRGGSFYYGLFAPEEESFVGNGSQAAFASTDPAVHSRIGGVSGTSFRSVFGVMIDGVPQIEGVDFTVSGGAAAPGSTATVTFTTAPANGADVRFAYFTSTAKTYPPTVNRSAVVEPGAVRGRNICVSIASGGSSTFQKVASVQTAQLSATKDIQVERELCNDDPVGYTVTGTNATGNFVARSRDAVAFFDIIRKMTGIDVDDEIVSWLNQNPVQLKIEIQNPKNPAAILKTLYVPDAIFNVPGTPARVNTVTDFQFDFNSQKGTYSAFKGAMA